MYFPPVVYAKLDCHTALSHLTNMCWFHWQNVSLSILVNVILNDLTLASNILSGQLFFSNNVNVYRFNITWSGKVQVYIPSFVSGRHYRHSSLSWMSLYTSCVWPLSEKKTRVMSHCQLVTQSIETRIRSSKVLQISLVLIVIIKHWHDSSFMLQNLCLRVSRIIVQTNKPYHNSESTFTSKHNQKTVHPLASPHTQSLEFDEKFYEKR